MRATIRLAFFVLVFLAFPPAARGLDLQPRIDPLARRLLEERRAVGFVVGIVKDGETQVSAYGEVKKGAGTAPSGDTVYEIGSITKIFTAVLLADMMQQGKVKLNAPVQQYLPDSVKMPIVDGRPITLEHLVTHTSGLPRQPDNMQLVDRHNPYAYYTVSQMYQFLGWYERQPPGKRYEYSNLGMGLLGHALALQAGKTYEQLLIERVCTPLDMQDTRPDPNADMLKRLAPPYDDLLRPASNWDLPTLGGAGGVRSTVHDMLKFIKANLADDAAPLTQAIRLTHRRHYTLPDGKGIGLAWRMSKNGSIVFHGGLTGGYRAWMAVVPSRQVGMVVLANTSNRSIEPFGDRVLHIALGSKTPAPTEAESDAAH